MSEITAAPDALRDEPPAPARQLRGNLGVASIVFMVVAAAAPLGVIGGVVPLGHRLGQRRRLPGDLHRLDGDPAVLRRRFHRDDAVCRGGRRVLLVCPHSRWASPPVSASPSSRSSAIVAIEAGVYGLLGPGRCRRRRTVRRPGAAVVGVRGGGVRRHDVPRLPQHRTVQPGAGGAADRRDRDRRRCSTWSSSPRAVTTGCRPASSTRSAIFSGSLGIGLLFAIISYVGFEATAIFRDEARTPERTIPRATYVALILIGVFYAVTSWALISGWGDDGGGAAEPPIRAAPSSATPRSATSASSAPTSSRCCTSPACSPASCRSTTWRRATCSPCRSATCCPSR